MNNIIMGQLARLAGKPARITEVQRDCATVHDGSAEYIAHLRHDLTIAVGDWVAVDDGWITGCAEPFSSIARRHSDGRRQVLATNVDTALLVMGLDQDFNLRRMERYIALVRSAGVAPVIVLTKADIGTDVEERLAGLRQRLPDTLPWLALNILADDVEAALAPWLGAGQTLVLLGQSGTGKSTLTNALCGSGQATGGVRRGDGRGRHTTTARSLHQCPGGACIIDTPGLRTWQPDADEETLAATFDDIESLAAQCQFRDCQHGAEPGCAVREVVDADRLQNYHKLLREARRSQQTPLDRIAERGKWKVLVKAAQARGKQKREGP